MTIDEILEQLSNNPTGSFPHAAINAAVEQQEAITPHLLAYLQELIDLGEDIDDDFNDSLTLFAIFLLGQFREARAYPLIIHLLTSWKDSAEFYFGDAITGGMTRILASICQGDIAPLKALVENEALDEFVRAVALESLVTLFTEQALSREDLLSYFTWLFREYPVRKDSFLWDSLIICCAAFRFAELLPDIRKAYEDGLADPTVASLKGIEDEIVSEYDNLDELWHLKHYITDTTAELSSWASFQPVEQRRTIPEPKGPVTPDRTPKGTVLHDSGTFLRAAPKTGRNDPCPCGSGKKFKKCCGR
ncbi:MULTISPECIES: DUF1186 domain-containing protein [Gammaproteobacteria]|uniref:DUF1186 domain-containing protein n=1 Tax=Gammaproteobacteria TaxID=1236 RepID=UPI001ADAF93C|nr:DUF1186 domain-containing protein [Salinisphaera sp. G21_0]MBO9494320.1 DUF1186 domain-containing protein [Thalassotalea sp. G20_0]